MAPSWSMAPARGATTMRRMRWEASPSHGSGRACPCHVLPANSLTHRIRQLSPLWSPVLATSPGPMDNLLSVVVEGKLDWNRAQAYLVCLGALQLDKVFEYISCENIV